MAQSPKISIVAPSAVVPQVELGLGVERLEAEGFAVRVSPQCRRKHLFFAGPDELRAKAFYDAALAEDTEVVWCARGGYGAFRLLPLLEKLPRPSRRKLLVGYSDSTALMEFARTRWGWATLHGPMPSFREFSLFGEAEMGPVAALVRGERPKKLPWEKRRLKSYGALPERDVEGEIVGGNLTVWASMLGTPYAGRAEGRILFIEDVTESLYRIDRMLRQLKAAGGLDGVRAVLLGTWHLCEDAVPKVLKAAPAPGKAREKLLRDPRPRDLVPLRKTIAQNAAFGRIFGGLARELGVPVLGGLPVGHGPNGHAPLPLGGRYRITTAGALELLDWDWKMR